MLSLACARGRTVRTTDLDPDYSCPGHGVGCASAVLSQLTEHGADRLSLITFVDQQSPGAPTGTLFLAATSLGRPVRLGYSAQFEHFAEVKGNASECGMYEKYET